MTRQVNHHFKNRQETILAVAEEVFAQYSFDGATIRLISKRSGVNSSMIGYYFGSKEALYLDIFKLRLEAITEEINRFEILDLDPAEKLKTYLTTYIERIASNQSFYRLICNELVSTQRLSVVLQVSETRKRIHDFLLKIIHCGTANGCFRKIDEEVLVLNILGLAWSFFTDHLSRSFQLSTPLERGFTQRIVDYIMTMLTRKDHAPLKIHHHE